MMRDMIFIRPLRTALLLLAVSVAVVLPGRAALACCADVGCVLAEHNQTRQFVTDQHNQTREHFGYATPLPNQGAVRGELGAHEDWIINGLFKEHILPSLMLMTEQMSTVAMQQMIAVGAFMDADQQLKTQRLLQERTARAHKDYQPSMSMCVFGTNIRNMAAAQFDGDYEVQVLNRRFMARQTGQKYDSTSLTPGLDDLARAKQFRDVFCDRQDINPIPSTGTGTNADSVENSGLRGICRKDVDKEQAENADIDFTRSIMMPRTINMDTVNPANRADESVFEMASLLYGHTAMNFPSPNDVAKKGAADDIMDLRTLAATRNVAQNSFNHIIGLKTVGANDSMKGVKRGASAAYLKAVLVELGIPQADTDKYLSGLSKGTNGEISYYAQMELLAKKIYQSPDFYTNLYDTPVNVKRQAVAMQAIKLMLDREIYDSNQRSEMLMSLILESKLSKYRGEIANDFGTLQGN